MAGAAFALLLVGIGAQSFRRERVRGQCSRATGVCEVIRANVFGERSRQTTSVAERAGARTEDIWFKHQRETHLYLLDVQGGRLRVDDRPLLLSRAKLEDAAAKLDRFAKDTRALDATVELEDDPRGLAGELMVLVVLLVGAFGALFLGWRLARAPSSTA